MGIIITFGKSGRRAALVPEVIEKIQKKWSGVQVAAASGQVAEKAKGKKSPKGAGVEQMADLGLWVNAPGPDEVVPVRKGGVLVCLTSGKDSWAGLAKQADNVLALEKLPRTSRAQAMDVLSSQANLGGYAAGLAVAHYMPRLMPQMMTAAGSSKPANVLVLGVGVAGLQAIATARRLGAQVKAFDVRPEVAEQIRSLGAKVVEVEGASVAGQGGYAGAMDAAGLKVLQEKLLPFIAAADGVISTAQVPGKPAPVLISKDAVAAMRAGSVVVDMAAGGFNKANGIAGGNCELTVADAVVESKNGVTLVGETNWADTLAGDASRFWATNMLNLLGIMLDKDGNLTFEDELVKAMMVVKDGKVIA